MTVDPPTGRPGPSAFNWRQFAGITGAAVAVFAGLRLLPTGTNLSHMDFRLESKGAGAIEFCDPLNPQFIPVVAARSPVTMTIAGAGAAVVGREVQAVVSLHTGSGKPIAPEDLLVTHTRRLHLLIVDPTLTDYQHLHPEPTRRPGEWAVAFTPRREGVYRIFADFTPAATGRGLYASADLGVSAAGAIGAGEAPRPGQVAARGEYRFTLAALPQPARAGRPIDLSFTVARRDEAPVKLEPVMGAEAHLVAFDAARSGFAHLHPVENERAKTPATKATVLNFKLTIPRAGPYTVWAQVNLGGREEFVPFALEVVD